MEDERDIVVFSDEDGNEIELEVIDYFFHNGEEYAVLIDTDESDENCDCEEDDDDCCCGCGHDHGTSQDVYIMKIVVNGENEEFIPVEENKMEELIKIVQNRLTAEFDEDDEDFDEEE